MVYLYVYLNNFNPYILWQQPLPSNQIPHVGGAYVINGPYWEIWGLKPKGLLSRLWHKE